MEKGPEQNNKLTRSDKWYIAATGATLFGLMCSTIPFQKNETRVDNAMIYGLPGVYGTFIITMLIYGSIIKNK